MKEIKFEHIPSRHCETGVTANLLRHKGFEITENLILGIGAGLYFIHMPFIKLMGTPMTSYRYAPGAIVKKAAKHLGIDLELKTFPNVQKAMAALDQKIDEGVPVGITGDLYYMDAFPEFVQIHFGAHNIIVYGRNENGDYLVSDPIFEKRLIMAREKLEKARFGKGFDNPKGRMYWVKNLNNPTERLPTAIKEGIDLTCKRMLGKFFPFGGVSGMRLLAKKLRKYPKKLTAEQASNYLTNYIRMQEIIGTGAGYRVLFMGFLNESSKILNAPILHDFAERLTNEIITAWRQFAIDMGRASKKDVKKIPEKYEQLAESLLKIADLEESFFKDLKKVKL